jgi:hypothetical protein
VKSWSGGWTTAALTDRHRTSRNGADLPLRMRPYVRADLRVVAQVS